MAAATFARRAARLRIILATCAAFLGCTTLAQGQDRKPPPKLHSYAGIQGLLAIGVHSDIAGRQYGIGGGPLLQFLYVPSRRLAVHIEGIPVVSIPRQKASAFYGQATPALGIFIASARFAFDPRSRYWGGIGTTIINQRTPLPNIGQVASSRLAGVRYELFMHQPLRGNRFLQAQAAVTPSLFGADHFFYSDGVTPAVDKPERAAEEDFSVAYGVQHANSEWLVGLRSLNFSAVFTKTGLAADRNNGAGIILEWRRYLSR
ncbi:MAG: hypothetical protein ABR584_03875 [Candidatus Baltobacteraceae bacterium]